MVAGPPGSVSVEDAVASAESPSPPVHPAKEPPGSSKRAGGGAARDRRHQGRKTAKSPARAPWCKSPSTASDPNRIPRRCRQGRDRLSPCRAKRHVLPVAGVRFRRLGAHGERSWHPLPGLRDESVGGGRRLSSTGSARANRLLRSHAAPDLPAPTVLTSRPL